MARRPRTRCSSRPSQHRLRSSELRPLTPGRPYSPARQIAYHRAVTMRIFAALYAAAALLAAVGRSDARDPMLWAAVCVTAGALGLASACGRPQVMLSGAHAGLTATWAGTLAAR